MAKVPAAQDRRSGQRIRAVHLSAKLRCRGVMCRLLRRREAAVRDFSRQGIALCSDSRFRAGDRIELQLQSTAEHISGIRGTVRHVIRDRGEYNLGIEFDAGAGTKGKHGSVSNILDCMEQVVEHQLA